ncbi:MAG: T9SS type A sorting domain-containing protein [Bacteroidales bacterium]|nr:T9SS type A sorting domain-containing protein [Bacteroidales bacterium]
MKTGIAALIILLFGLPLNLFSQAVTYNNFSDFKAAVQSAKAGDEIVLAAGRYEASSITMNTIVGTKDNPVIIRAENIGEDTLDNGTYFDLRHCSHIIIQGFYINITEKSTTFKIQTCNNIRITQNILNGEGESYYKDDGVSRNSSVWISIQSLYDDLVNLSHHNVIDHNLLINKHTLGNAIRIDGTDDLYVSQYDVIEYNHFKNIGPRATNEMETIRIGWSAMSQSDGFTTVANNLFEECDGDPEIISVKCNKNNVSHNTFLRCQGTLSLRHGNESIIEGNFFLGEGAEGTGGVRIYGSDHKIINNYFEGLTGTKWDAPITLTEGDAEEGDGGLTKHFRIERAIIANNTLINNDYGIEIGYDNNGSYSKPPRDVIIAYNVIQGDTNTLVNFINLPVNMLWVNNLINQSDDAIITNGTSFTSNQVVLADPFLEWNNSLGYFKSTAQTPVYDPNSSVTGPVNSDIDGQLRSLQTNYGADEYNEQTIIYRPLTPSQVGPSLGEYLNLSKSELTFPMAGGEMNVEISTNLNWIVSNEDDWLQINPVSGSESGDIQIIVNENLTANNRTAFILVISTNISEGDEKVKPVRINQLGTDPPKLSISESSLAFTAEQSSASVSILSNTRWSVMNDSPWIDITPLTGENNGEIIVTVEENILRSYRKVSIVVSDGAYLNQSIDITQSGATGTEVKLPIINAIASTEQTAEGNIAANVYDGLLSNRWSGEGDGAYISLDLGKTDSISFIKVGLYKADSRNSYFDILCSGDGVNYQESLMGVISEITNETLVIYDFNNTSARYLRLVGHGNSSNLWNSYTEFEIWGWPLTNTSTHIPNESNFEAAVFPNPSTGSFSFSLREQANISIFNINGAKVYQKNNVKDSDIITPNIHCGVYFIKIGFKDSSVFQKLIIDK